MISWLFWSSRLSHIVDIGSCWAPSKPQTGPPCMNSCCRAQDQHRRGIFFLKKGTTRWDEAIWVVLPEKRQKAARRVLQRSGTKIRPRTPWFIFMLSARRVNRLMCRDPHRWKFIDSSFVVDRDKFWTPPVRANGVFTLAEKCWAFMQSWQYPQPWFSVMRLTSSMHETRKATADGRQGTRPAHYRASKILEKEKEKGQWTRGLPRTQSWSTSIHVCCAVDYISTTYNFGTYSSRRSRPVYSHVRIIY